jgi:hypothetical protein|tara:strand:- start:1815 stop:2000 length:186 start_codon:yes stop_codon:yes gene_type:complete
MAKELKDIIEEVIKDLIQDGKIEIQDTNGDKIEDLSVGYAESDDEDFDDEDFDNDEEDDNE